jgi:hypothetical protein
MPVPECVPVQRSVMTYCIVSVMPLRLGVDVDGVLADFRSAFRTTARKCLGREVVSETNGSPPSPLGHGDVEKVWAHIARTSNWWMQLEPYEPAEIARLYAIARASRWEVFFLTKRPPSAGDPVQFQTQSWLERQGFYLPAVLTVPGSRGELANALRLDLVVDDQIINCVEIIGAGPAKTLLMLRDPDPTLGKHATDRGIAVVASLAEALPLVVRLEEVLPTRIGKPLRLLDWFTKKREETLPLNPRGERPLPD